MEIIHHTARVSLWGAVWDKGSDIWDFVCIEVEAGALGFTGSLFIDEFKTQEQEFKAQEEKNKQLKQWVIEINQDLQNKGAWGDGIGGWHGSGSSSVAQNVFIWDRNQRLSQALALQKEKPTDRAYTAKVHIKKWFTAWRVCSKGFWDHYFRTFLHKIGSRINLGEWLRISVKKTSKTIVWTFI